MSNASSVFLCFSVFLLLLASLFLLAANNNEVRKVSSLYFNSSFHFLSLSFAVSGKCVLCACESMKWTHTYWCFSGWSTVNRDVLYCCSSEYWYFVIFPTVRWLIRDYTTYANTLLLLNGMWLLFSYSKH